MIQIKPTFSLILFASFLVRNIFAIKEETDHVFTAEELAKYVGKDGGPIYLSILGEVYDVTSGKDYYASESGYSFFAGRDATVCFFTGEYTEEHLNEKRVLDLEGTDIMAIEEWRGFYETHETYRFLGVLEGDYYDSEGNETPDLVKIRKKWMTAKKEYEERERQRAEDLARRRAARKAKQEAEAKAEAEAAAQKAEAEVEAQQSKVETEVETQKNKAEL